MIELKADMPVLWYPLGNGAGVPILTSTSSKSYMDEGTEKVFLKGEVLSVPIDHLKYVSMDDKAVRIRQQVTLLFSDSIGCLFRIKGSEIYDFIAEVDTVNSLVSGEQYKNVLSDLVELAGGKKD